MSDFSGWLGGKRAVVLALAIGLLVGGCMVGPDYKAPAAPTTQSWLANPTTQLSTQSSVQMMWWKSFNDPVLDKLIEMAYGQNLTLRQAGLRVLQARAARGIAVGNFFPQTQQLNGSYSHNNVGKVRAPFPRYFDASSASFDVNWELDVWGKFRRGIESADDSLYASVMTYDDALVTLVADVATTYINIRGFDQQILLAQQNVSVEQSALDIANVRFKAGGTTELDVQQARAQLSNTQALIPSLELSREQAEHQLCVLLGIPPSDLSNLLGTEPTPIPIPPQSVAVGIPAELLRRRPDIRAAEASAAAQCAQIGVATADLLPHFYLFGSIGYSAQNPGDLFKSSSLAYQVGPSFSWNILNYGQITNNVRVQDALFEQLIANYQNTVLTAQQDVEDSITGFIQGKQQSDYLNVSVDAAQRSVNLSLTQYRTGGADFSRVLIATNFLVQQQQSLVTSQIGTVTSVIELNKALGGGWELRDGHEFVDPETISRMRNRTDWGNITDADYHSKSDMLIFPRPAIPTTYPDNQ